MAIAMVRASQISVFNFIIINITVITVIKIKTCKTYKTAYINFVTRQTCLSF